MKTTPYDPTWDLTTIPDAEWHKENGRRQRKHAPPITYVKYKPCAGCSKPLTAVQRRKPCPNCGRRNDPRTKAGKGAAS